MTDRNYWETFYAKQNAELKPSLFARFVAENVKASGKNLIEFGCGNARDAVFFANESYNVLAVDQCENEMKFLRTRYQKVENLRFLAADFTCLAENQKFDIAYSRFTLHSITAKQEANVLAWTYKNLNTNGRFCIEVRGQKNEIYQKGDAVVGEPDAFIYNNHYRRFLNFDRFCEDLKHVGFQLEYAVEEKDFAPFNGENETFIRVIAAKK